VSQRAKRLSLGAMVSSGVAAARGQARLLVRLFLVEVAASLVFIGGAALALRDRFGVRPLFARGVAGDDEALASVIGAEPGVFHSIGWVGIAWALTWALFSLYLGAGLLGAFAGRRFGETAGQKFGAFLRLWLYALLPWAIGLAVCGAGIAAADLETEDLLTLSRAIGRPLVALLPGLFVLGILSCAVDYARARLVLTGGGPLRALGFGLGRALVRPTAFLHVVLYVLVWVAVSALYVAGTYGVAFAGFGGALALFALRQVVAGARFVARSATTAGQLRALEVEVLEVREVVERLEPLRDLGEAEIAQRVE